VSLTRELAYLALWLAPRFTSHLVGAIQDSEPFTFDSSRFLRIRSTWQVRAFRCLGYSLVYQRKLLSQTYSVVQIDLTAPSGPGH
jgi:hypothetical protein